MKYSYTAALMGTLAHTAIAHSWVEQIMNLAANGTMVGEPGYARGNVLRSSPGFGDPTMVNLIPPNTRPINQITDQDLMCKDSQRQQSQTSGSPRLQTIAGANIALQYQENGHVTLPQNQPGKPTNRGTIYVYGTTESTPDDKFLSIHRQWTPDGKGGDGRGVLLSTRDFDDSQCYQVNNGAISVQRQKTFSHVANQLMGANLWCQTDIQIPTNAPSGKPYTLYWVWDWPTLPGTQGFPEGKQEIYTTCMDVDVTDAATGSHNKAAGGPGGAVNFAVGQDLASAAVANQFTNIANPTAVTGDVIPFSAQVAATSAGSGSGNNQASSSQIAATTAIATTTTQGVLLGSDGNAVGYSRPSVSPINQPTTSQDSASAPQAPNTIATQPAAATSIVGAGSPSTVTEVQTIIDTVVATKMETVYATGQSKRSEPTAALEAYPSIRLAERKDARPTSRCSKTESVYRLRARQPFVIVGNPYKAASTSTAAC